MMTMLAILLAIVLSVSPVADIEVDVCEINTTTNFRQVILYRWTWAPAGRSHHVAQWWITKSEPTVTRIGERWMVESDGRLFIARSLRRTKTQFDPEISDRKKLHEGDRKPYLCVPQY